MSLNLDLGFIKVAVPTKVGFEGDKGQFFSTERAALISRAKGELNDRWYKVLQLDARYQYSSGGAPSFSQVYEFARRDPALFEAIVKLSRFEGC